MPKVLWKRCSRRRKSRCSVGPSSNKKACNLQAFLFSQPFAGCYTSVSGWWLFKRQRHVAQITLGFDQYQRCGNGLNFCSALARHVYGLGFRRHGRFCLCNFADVRVHPLQASAAGNCCQVLQRQVIRLDFWQTGRRCGYCSNSGRCSFDCGRCLDRCASGRTGLGYHWRFSQGCGLYSVNSGGRYEFRSFLHLR